VIAELRIDTGALRRNAARFATLVAPARLGAVVKANGYGHGLVPVARALEDVAARVLVYSGDEALALRAAGSEAELLVLGPVEPASLAALHQANVAITLWDEGAFARDIARVGAALGRPFDVHAKVDTGVTRLGLEPARAAVALEAYGRDPALRLRGVYTHLAAAEELESQFTLQQLATFETALAPLDAELRARGVQRHAAATAAAILFPKLRLDFVRVGIGLYGIWPSPETEAAASGTLELEPALAWTSELVVVRDVEAGRSVGYGCTFHTARPSRIAVVPIGYAEGVPRALSNRGAMLVHGKRAPIVGRVCMNMSFLDVTDVPQAQPGSRVTLIGRDGSASISANEFGEWADTIGYEIVARLPEAIPRRYVATSEIGAPLSAGASATRSSSR
jgi:alanine racemase